MTAASLNLFPPPQSVAGVQRANAAATGLVWKRDPHDEGSPDRRPAAAAQSLHSVERGPDLGWNGKMVEGVTYRPVEALKPAAGYIGGKRMLARAVIAQIERVPHETYAEAFVGMGGVFFRRDQAARAEVINDRSGDVATFFRVLQRHYLPFVEMLRWQVASRREFERADYERLAEALRGLQGRFILSINDVPAVRRAFAGFAMKPVGVTYTVSKGPARRARELIITGGALPPSRREGASR